ncbi:hypothetical protein TorRG33x02_331430 [Trema orientale]|uniref:Uncharacterized protein n=1 Tax=Trema orientale TaxID=63057 RepID=A0A2P5B5U8_TREOI|nr:hypothetical protein TorRG33x02_331430 [Trema orientale]
MSMAPRSDPAVRPMGKQGTDGKTAITQKIPKAIEPNTTFTVEAIAIFVKAGFEKIFCGYELSSIGCIYRSFIALSLTKGKI